MINKSWKKLLSVLLSVAMLLSLAPGIGLTASAISVAEEWTTDITVTETRTINGNVLADSDITLTIAEGVTLTVNGQVITYGATLTAAGGGTLVVNGVNGSNGTDHNPVGGVYNGTAGYSGGPGISGNIYVAGASVVVNGGNGGNGGSSETDGAAGGNGGNAIDGDVTLESGSITATGGKGGSGGIILMGGSGANGSDGKAVTGSITATGTGATVQESDNDTDWSYVSGGSSDKRFIHGEVPAPAHVHSLTPHAAENAGCTTAGNSAYWSCSCGMYFSDENGETEIAENSWVIPALGHNYDNVAYSSDDTQHWKVCSRCNEDSDKENHTWGEATYTWSADNSQVTARHTCTQCGKEVSETVDTSSQVTAAATCTTAELTTYTANFTKDGFTAQTNEGVETEPALGHQFGYEASGDTVTATCERAACGYHTNVTITAPALTVYGGAESAAATFEGLDAFNTATGKSVVVTDVKYVGRDGTAYTESSTAPTGAGKYTAKITVEGATASVNYEIAKTGSSAATVAANEWTFDGATKPLVTVTGDAAGGTMKYALGTATAPGTFGDSIPEATDPDTYYVWYKVAGDANHNDTDAVCVTVVVAHDEELDAVIAAINAIGPVTEVLADQKAKIDAARAGYEDLTPAQQQLVTNYATLTTAEADYKALFVYSASTQITVSGTERIGETLTATATDIPAFITDSVVRWYNEDGDLLGTGDTYVIAESQIGKTIRAELYSEEAEDSVFSDYTGAVDKGVIKNYTLPTAAHIMYPQTLADATLTGGDTGDIEGVWAWVTPDAQPTSAQSGSSFELTFTPTGVYADLYEGITTRLAVIIEPAPFEPQAIEDTASGLTFDAEFAQNVEVELTDIAYSQSAYLALLRASKKDDSGMTRLVLLKTIVFTIDGEEADEAYNGAVTVTSYVGAKLAGQTVSVWFFIDGEPVNYVGTVGYDGVLVIENVAL